MTEIDISRNEDSPTPVEVATVEGVSGDLKPLAVRHFQIFMFVELKGRGVR